MNNYFELKRDDTSAIIRLPQDVQWFDEFDYSPLAQSNPVYTLNGAMVVQEGLKQAGRPITLGGEWVWHKRGDFKLLKAWRDTPLLTMTLTHYDLRTFSVKFRNHEQAIDCQPVVYQTPESDNTPYIGEIRLMTV